MGDVTDILRMTAGMALVIGTGAAYLMQIVPVVRHRSAAGINPWSIALTVLSGVFLAINVFITQYTGDGGAGAIPLAQVCVSIPIAFSLLVCIGIFSPTRTWVWASSATSAVGATVLLAYVVLTALAPEYVAESGVAFGILAALVTAVIWLPQVYTLVRWREIGELSLWFLLLEAAGALLVLGYQATEFGVADGWTSWLAGLVQAVELLVLVAIYLVLRFQQRKRSDPPSVIEFVGEPEDTEMGVFTEEKEE